jgi:hypothetical protein
MIGSHKRQMHAPQPSQHLERVRRATAYPVLRLLVDIFYALGNVFVISVAVMTFRIQGWLGLLQLIAVLPMFVARGLALALALLDIADLQLRQGLLNETARVSERAEPPA